MVGNQIIMRILVRDNFLGTKKWITNGTFADYFTVGCKTEVWSFRLNFAPYVIKLSPGWLHSHPR
jgi:hypothetical protein